MIYHITNYRDRVVPTGPSPQQIKGMVRIHQKRLKAIKEAGLKPDDTRLDGPQNEANNEKIDKLLKEKGLV